MSRVLVCMGCNSRNCAMFLNLKVWCEKWLSLGLVWLGWKCDMLKGMWENGFVST